jgi:hypothetical protein
MKQRIQTLYQNLGNMDHKTKIELVLALTVGVVCGLFVLFLPVLWYEMNADNLLMGVMTNILLSP